MKQTISSKASRLIVDFKRLTRSPKEREMFEIFLKRGQSPSVVTSGYTVSDRTDLMCTMIRKLGLKVKACNNAPRGGKHGNYIAHDNDEFVEKCVDLVKRYEQFQRFKHELKNKQARERFEQQKIQLKNYLDANPDFKNKLEKIVAEKPSKKYRNILRLKVCKALNNGRFSDFELSAGIILSILYNVEY